MSWNTAPARSPMGTTATASRLSNRRTAGSNPVPEHLYTPAPAAAQLPPRRKAPGSAKPPEVSRGDTASGGGFTIVQE